MSGLKKRNLLLVIVLYLITGGLYGIYWTAKTGFASNSKRAQHQTSILPILFIAVFMVLMSTVFVVVMNLQASQPTMRHSGVLLLIAAFAVVLTYVLAAALSVRIARVIQGCGSGPCSTALAVALTFAGFTNAIYLQHCINRLPHGILPMRAT